MHEHSLQTLTVPFCPFFPVFVFSKSVIFILYVKSKTDDHEHDFSVLEIMEYNATKNDFKTLSCMKEKQHS